MYVLLKDLKESHRKTMFAWVWSPPIPNTADLTYLIALLFLSRDWIYVIFLNRILLQTVQDDCHLLLSNVKELENFHNYKGHLFFILIHSSKIKEYGGRVWLVQLKQQTGLLASLYPYHFPSRLFAAMISVRLLEEVGFLYLWMDRAECILQLLMWSPCFIWSTMQWKSFGGEL